MLLRFIIFCTKIALLFGIIGVAILAYAIYHCSRNLPDYSQLKQYYPPSITRIYSSDGKLMEEYAKEHRIFVPIHSIPKFLVEAFIATEDKNFYTHAGIDIFSIIRATINNVSHVLNNQRVEGGSTITQQVVKNFLLTSERSLDRKVMEAILSYMVTQTFSKEKILELYLNQIYLGKGVYGVAAATLNYFNKSVEELTLNEAAVLASLPKAPSKFNPEKNYKRAFARKNYVIGRMYDDGYITGSEAKKAIAKPITLAKFDKVQTLDADYYAEKIRKEVIGMFGEEYFYTAGLTIITCVDSELQHHVANALRFGIKKYDMKRGYRGPLNNINLINWQNDLKKMTKPTGLRHYKIAVVLNVEKNQAKIGLQNGATSNIFLKNMKWTTTKLSSVAKILKKGDIIVIEKLNDKYVLQQIPDVNGGIIVVDHNTGRVLAAEGGYDFDNSKFDRTTQANRQPGSLIKPFVYLAALESGASPSDIFEDAPIELDQGPGLPSWKPKNYGNKFLGPMTLRKGFEKSRNTVTIRVGLFAGMNKIAEIIKRFCINDNPIAVESIVLGTLETTLSKMVMAYCIIANNGRKVEPHYIELIKDRKGNVIYKRDYTECPECKSYLFDEDGVIIPPKIKNFHGGTITDESTNYQIVSLMMGSVQRGTSMAAKHIKQIIAGKTGTTNKAKDTWFIGFTPKIVVGTYIGYDTPKSLGIAASGATVALPVFVHFMQNGYKDMPSVNFAVPESIMLTPVDYETGKPSTDNGAIIEALKKNDHNLLLKNENIKQDPFEKIQMHDTSQKLY